MTNYYEIGERVRIRTNKPFQDTATATPFDPDVVRFEVKTPGGATASYVYDQDDPQNQNAAITKLATGDYACDVDVDVGGRFPYYLIGEMDDGENRGAAQGLFEVLKKAT